MAFGSFTFTGHLDALNGAPASGVVRIDGIPQVLVDTAGKKVKVGPKSVVLDQLGNFTVSLPVDTAYNSGAHNGFRVSVDLKGLTTPPSFEFLAPLPGVTLDYATVIPTTVVPLAPTGVSRADFDAYVAANPPGGGNGGGLGNNNYVVRVLGADNVSTDQATLQNALTAAATYGADVVTEGVFNLNNTLTMTGRRQRLSGNGHLKWTAGIATKDAITVTGDDCTIAGIRMTNPNVLRNDQSTGYNVGIRLTANRCKVLNIVMDGFQHGIIESSNGEYEGCVISGNHILNILGAGEGPTDTSTTASVPYGDQGEDRGDGIVSWGAGTVITNNIVTCAVGGDARIGIHIEGLSANHGTSGQARLPDKFATITGNIVYGQFRRGISNESVGGAVISNNTVEGSTWWGISATQLAARDTVITNNHVYWTRTAADLQGSSASPIRTPIQVLYGASNVIVANNTIRITSTGNARAALCVLGSSTLKPENVSFQNNSIYIDSGGVCQDGLYVSGFVTSVEFKGNRLIGQVTNYGIQCGTAVRADVIDNYLDGLTITAGVNVKGILFDNGSKGECRGNKVTNYAKAIERYGATGATVTNNDCGNCTTGIDIGTATTTLMAGNNLTGCTTKISGSATTANGNIIRDNIGYLNVAKGTGVIADVTSSIAVTHGLATTPTVVNVTPRLGEVLWVSARTSTTFTVTRTGTAGAHTFDWRAEV